MRRTWILVLSLAVSASAWAQRSGQTYVYSGTGPAPLGWILFSSSGLAAAYVEGVAGEHVRLGVYDSAGSIMYDSGQKIDVTMPVTFHPRPGTTVLRYCTATICPSWVAIERDNYFAVRSLDPLEEIAPGVMEPDSRSRDNEVCVRARVLWLGQLGKLGRLEGRFHPFTGEGIVWGRDVGRPRRALLALGAGLGPWPDEAVTITLQGARRVRLAGGPIRRHHDGCYEVDVMPAAPLADAPRALKALLAGRPSPALRARGKMTLGGRAISFVLSVDEEGTAFVESAALAGPRGKTRTLVDGDTLALRLGIGTYVLDFGALSPPLPGAGLAAALAMARRLRRDVNGTIYTSSDPETAVGRFVVRPLGPGEL